MKLLELHAGLKKPAILEEFHLRSNGRFGRKCGHPMTTDAASSNAQLIHAGRTSIVSSPIECIATDNLERPPQDGIALCLSGGGYRAMLFHVGALIRLNEMGQLRSIDKISSVSGGSITSAVFGLKWHKLNFDSNLVATNFLSEIVEPIRTLAGRTIDVPSVLSGLVKGGVADQIAHEYRTYLFGNATLQDLPATKPVIVINAANMQSKALWRFSRRYMWDWRVGKIDNPTTELAIAVAASSAFPPFLSPLVLHQRPEDFTPNTGYDLQREPFTSEVVLTDGGVYDNLGLETAWKNFSTIWVSDAGGMYAPEEHPHRDWVRHTLRVLDLLDNQVRSLRKRQLIGSYKAGVRKGAYWGIWEDISAFGSNASLPCPLAKTLRIAQISTRLEGLGAVDQNKIINWGYAICDAAMRKYGGIGPNLIPKGFPCPQVGVG
jgi:NTE family protein